MKKVAMFLLLAAFMSACKEKPLSEVESNQRRTSHDEERAIKAGAASGVSIQEVDSINLRLKGDWELTSAYYAGSAYTDIPWIMGNEEFTYYYGGKLGFKLQQIDSVVALAGNNWERARAHLEGLSYRAVLLKR